jgi:tetratricopeptide (TPR) repeat protein
MRVLATSLLSLLILTAAASPPPPQEPPLSAISPAEKLDRLFVQLKRTRDASAAQQISSEFWAVWGSSGSATVDLLVRSADAAIEKKQYAVALDNLDEAIGLKPSYAEAWNKRATLHFKTGNYERSMADIAQVLAREPRHFGALSGMAAILQSSGRDAASLAVWDKVLDLYPANRAAQSQVRLLSEKLAGSKT